MVPRFNYDRSINQAAGPSEYFKENGQCVAMYQYVNCIVANKQLKDVIASPSIKYSRESTGDGKSG
jgi:hypothetical protein